jgi:hypothetical protein
MNMTPTVPVFEESDFYRDMIAEINKELGIFSEIKGSNWKIEKGGVSPKIRGGGLYTYLRRALYHEADKKGAKIRTQVAPTMFLDPYLETETEKKYRSFKFNTIASFYNSFGH